MGYGAAWQNSEENHTNLESISIAIPEQQAKILYLAIQIPMAEEPIQHVTSQPQLHNRFFESEKSCALPILNTEEAAAACNVIGC